MAQALTAAYGQKSAGPLDAMLGNLKKRREADDGIPRRGLGSRNHEFMPPGPPNTELVSLRTTMEGSEA